MAKALNKRSMQIYADREKCTDAREAQAERHFQMEDCRRWLRSRETESRNAEQMQMLLCRFSRTPR